MYGVSLKREVERQPRWRKGVWFGEGEEEEFICQFCGGGRERIKKIIRYLMVFIKIRIEARQLSVQFAT